jgi:hypothetical protein
MPAPTNQQILDALRTAYFEIASGGVQSYTVNGRTYTSIDLDKLQKAISHYENLVARATRRMFAPIRFRSAR